MSKKSKTKDKALESQLEKELNDVEPEVKAEPEKINSKPVKKLPVALIMKSPIDVVVPIPGHPEVHTCKRFAAGVKVVRPIFIDAIMKAKIGKYDIVE